jgi:hypothetical protein
MGTLAAQDRRELSSSKERLSRSPTSEAVSNGYSSRAGARRSRVNGTTLYSISTSIWRYDIRRMSRPVQPTAETWSMSPDVSSISLLGKP